MLFFFPFANFWLFAFFTFQHFRKGVKSSYMLVLNASKKSLKIYSVSLVFREVCVFISLGICLSKLCPSLEFQSPVLCWYKWMWQHLFEKYHNRKFSHDICFLKCIYISKLIFHSFSNSLPFLLRYIKRYHLNWERISISSDISDYLREIFCSIWGPKSKFYLVKKCTR